ncbi:MAG: hypothetical protein ACRCYO_15440 [Bacteroidia bacterium]
MAATYFKCNITLNYSGFMTLASLTNDIDSPPIEGSGTPPAVMQKVDGNINALAIQTEGTDFELQVVYNLPDGSQLTIHTTNEVYQDNPDCWSRVSSASLFHITNENLMYSESSSGNTATYSFTVQM